MPKLNTNVYVHTLPFGETKNSFGPDDQVPDWAAAQIGDHCWDGGKAPTIKKAEEPKTDGPPAMSGKGSSLEAWKAYAEKLEVPVDADASREQIVDAIKAAGKPVE